MQSNTSRRPDGIDRVDMRRIADPSLPRLHGERVPGADTRHMNAMFTIGCSARQPHETTLSANIKHEIAAIQAAIIRKPIHAHALSKRLRNHPMAPLT